MEDKDVVVLSSGRKLYGFGGIFGISCTSQPGEHFHNAPAAGFDESLDNLDEPLTPAESVELADRMIEAWARYRDQAAAHRKGVTAMMDEKSKEMRKTLEAVKTASARYEAPEQRMQRVADAIASLCRENGVGLIRPKKAGDGWFYLSGFAGGPRPHQKSDFTEPE